ncbi:hypothetical protein NQZ79_g7173 [Umbelopsis isabellina]|nr:hypothetical protein NQZ79_g7173 [Umbelopsis isabellina]
MQPASALRPPLSQKSSNAQSIDLTSSTPKRYRLSLASAKARKNGHSQNENTDLPVPSENKQKTNGMPEKKADTESRDTPQVKQEAWSSEDELIRPRKHVKTKAAVVKRRTLSDKTRAPVSVLDDATGPASKESKSKEAAIENSVDTAAVTSSMSSPLYNDDNDDLMRSSPPSPIFYEKIVPRQVLSHDSDSSSDDFEMMAVHKSPLVAKQRRNQVQQSPAVTKTSATVVVSVPEEPPRNASRSILSELTVASKRNGQRLSIPHATGQGLADTSLSGQKRVGQEQLDHVPSIRQTMKAKAIDTPRMHTCPICNQDFSISVIEAHASDCNGQPSTTSQTTSKPTKQSSLQWSFPKKKAFTVYRDDADEVRSTKEDTKECPICHEHVVISIFQQHVDSELNDLTSGYTVGKEDHNTAVEDNVPSTVYDVDDHASDSECSVIDLVADPHPYTSSSSKVSTEVSLEEALPVEPARERSWSPVEGFQDIRQLKEQDPGYQMYFQQFSGRSGSGRSRSKSTGDGQDDCAQPTASRARAGSSKSKPYKAKPSSAALRRYRQYKRKGKN